MIDLHIHTTASADGQYSPKKIVPMAKRLGLSAIAFADHNVIGSVIEGRRLCNEAGIDFLEAVELNTDFEGRDLHLLGFGIDPLNDSFLEWLDRIDKTREQKARSWAENLASLGLKITYEEAASLTPGRLPTGSSFLMALTEHSENLSHPLVAPYVGVGPKAKNPYVDFYFEVLALGPAKSNVKELTTIDAIDKLNGFDALPILAHPSNLPRDILDNLIESGLKGVEAVSSYHDAKTTKQYIQLAKDKGLLISAGSDFHGPIFKKTVKLGGISPNSRWIFDALIDHLNR